MHEIEEFIQGGPRRGFGTIRVFGGKSFNELFTIEGTPLFWFYKRYLLKHVLPKPLNMYTELFQKKKLTMLRNMSSWVFSLALRRYVFSNELRKTNLAPPPKKITSARKALFLTYPDHLSDDNQLYRIQGIINKIRNDAVLEPFPLFVTPLSVLGRSSSKMPNAGLIYQYCDFEIKLKVTRWAEQIAQQWKQVDPLSLNQALTLNGLCLWSYVRSAFSLFMSKEFLFVLLLYYETCKTIIGKENVAITFISGQNGLFERCMAAASRIRGIPCILVPHGFAIGNLPAQDVLDNIYIPTFNKTTASSFIASGVPQKQVRVTGPAIYDSIVKYKKSKASEKTRSASERTILLLTQPLIEDNFMSPKDYFLMVEETLIEMMSIQGINIIIKLHPREKWIARYERIAQRLDRSRISIRQKGELNLLYSLLAEAKVVINFNATAGVLEASILDVPSITFPWDKKKSTKYGFFDPSLYVWERESLKPAIERLLKNPALLRNKRNRMVKEYCTFVDGKSSERIVQWAYELLDTCNAN